MKKRNTLIISFIIIILICTFIFSVVSAEKPTDVDIKIIGNNSQFKDNKAVIIAGIWHDFEITMPSQKPRDLKIILFKGEEIPAVKNFTNYYEWSYKENRNNEWKDNKEYNGYSYIKPDQCEKNKNVYKFCIGISDILPNDVFYKEAWSLYIFENDIKIYSDELYIEKATRGLAHSHGDTIYFYIDPFKKMSADGNDYFTLKNTGNIPLFITVDYSTFQKYIEFTDFKEEIPPKEKFDYYMRTDSDSWQPQIMEKFGEIKAKLPDKYIIDDSNAMVNLRSAFILDPPILNLFIGRSTLKLAENILDTGISFQYKENIEMNEGEIRDINAYISGEGSINLDIWTDDVFNIKILKIFNDGKEVNSPFSVFSSDDRELNITIRVEAIREGKNGDINYRFKKDNGKTKDFKTHVEVGPPLDEITEVSKKKTKLSFASNSLLTGAVVLSILIVILYMFISHLKHRRR